VASTVPLIMNHDAVQQTSLSVTAETTDLLNILSRLITSN